MEIQELRQKINEIDAQLVRQFDERMRVALEIAEYKKENGLPVFDPAREQEVLNRQVAAVNEEMAVYVRLLYNTLFDLSRSYQHRYMKQNTPLTDRIAQTIENTPERFPAQAVVACQGVEGAYSQLACEKLFAMPSVKYFKCCEDVFQAVENGLCQYGVLPIETSACGCVTEVYDLLRKHRFSIVRSVRMKNDHHLLAKHGLKMENEIVGYGQTIGQCSESCNSDMNFTRFACIAKNPEIYPDANKTSLMLSVQHRPGALYHLIARFSALGLNLTKLESRPVAGTDCEVMFYLDLDASVCDETVLQLLAQLDAGQDSFTYLGSYCEV